MPDQTVPFTSLPNLAAERVGAAVLAANDEFFAPKENLINPEKPVWKEVNSIARIQLAADRVPDDSVDYLNAVLGPGEVL